MHGGVVKWGSDQGEEDAIIHVDGPATIFAQGGFMSRSLQSIVQREGFEAGAEGPTVLTTDGLRRACDKLSGYVYDLRLFRKPSFR